MPDKTEDSICLDCLIDAALFLVLQQLYVQVYVCNFSAL